MWYSTDEGSSRIYDPQGRCLCMFSIDVGSDILHDPRLEHSMHWKTVLHTILVKAHLCCSRLWTSPYMLYNKQKHFDIWTLWMDHLTWGVRQAADTRTSSRRKNAANTLTSSATSSFRLVMLGKDRQRACLVTTPYVTQYSSSPSSLVRNLNSENIFTSNRM